MRKGEKKDTDAKSPLTLNPSAQTYTQRTVLVKTKAHLECCEKTACTTLHRLTKHTALHHLAHSTFSPSTLHLSPFLPKDLSHVVCPLSWDCRRWRHLQACMFCACSYRRADVCLRSRRGHSFIKTVIPEFWQRFQTVLMERTPPVSRTAQRRCVPMCRPGTVGSRISGVHTDDDQVIMLWRLGVTMRMQSRHRPLLIKSVVLPFVCFSFSLCCICTFLSICHTDHVLED